MHDKKVGNMKHRKRYEKQIGHIAVHAITLSCNLLLGHGETAVIYTT
jgi:hypothetical protein